MIFKKSVCLKLSFTYIILEIIIWILSLKVDFSSNEYSILIFVLMDLVIPILLYYFYFNSEYSKIVAFILPFFTSVFVWIMSSLFYHIRTNFIYCNNSNLGTGLYFGIFCTAHLILALIFTICCLIKRNRKK